MAATSRDPAGGGAAPAAASPSASSVARSPAVVTPDAVGLDLEVATVGSRGIAYLLDLLLLLSGLVLLSAAVGTFGAVGFGSDGFGTAALLLLLFAWQFGYPIGFETLWRGRTLGKAAMGLRVVTVEGAPVGVRHATIRATTAVLELLGSLGSIAVIASFASSRGQRLGDLAAGTLVVRERRAAVAPQSHVFAPSPGWATYARQLDVSRIGPEEYATVRDTLRRAPQLSETARQRVTARLAAALAPRVSPAPPSGIDPEQWLTCLAAAVQARRPPAAAREILPARSVPGAPAVSRSPSVSPDRPGAEGGFAPPD